ncbi:MAG: glycine cleavage system protein GcvH [Deltaproteobacteria bacterium]|nr:glycine cleavage system protein GcvH [Deltaproteobacteria bacterium]
MSNIPADLLFTSDHEWVRIEDGIATVGITDHAQDQLGDIVFCGDSPEPKTKVEKGDVVAVVESVKANSDIYCPVDGRVAEVNEELEEEPELVNADCYGRGWILKVKLKDNDSSDLLNAEQYEAIVDQES